MNPEDSASKVTLAIDPVMGAPINPLTGEPPKILSGKVNMATLFHPGIGSIKGPASFNAQFRVGQGVIFSMGQGTYKFAFVRAVIFTSCKVRYSLWIPSMESTLHNVDSVFVEPDPEPKFKDFGEDNYS